MAQAINFLRSAGKKVIVEYKGRVFSIPEQDFLRVSRLDRDRGQESDPQQHLQYLSKPDGCYAAKEVANRALSDTDSELSDSNLSNDLCTPQATNPMDPVVSSSAAKVLSELKDEVTRLIDESIQKIELEWVQNTKTVNDAPCDAGPTEAVTDSVHCTEDTARNLHPDGDRGQLTHREQNLQVLQTELFVASKRQTRMKLLNEIRELVERLKDLETLEE